MFGILPVIGTSLLGHWALTRNVTQTAGNRLVAVAERLASSIDAEVRLLVANLGGPDPTTVRLVRTLSEADRPSRNPDGTAEQLSAVLSHPAAAELEAIRVSDSARYLQLSLADAYGQLVAATHPVTNIDVQNEDWWSTAWNRGAGTTYISRLLRAEGRWVLTVAIPVRDKEGTTAGVLRLLADLSRIADVIDEGAVGTTGVATVTSGYGDILMASGAGGGPLPPVTVGRHHRFAVGIPDWFRGRGLSGRDAIVAYAPVKVTAGRGQATFGGTIWYVTTEQDRAEILHPTRQFSQLALVLTLVVTGIVVVVGVLLGRRVARPLLSLRDGARRIGEGQLKHRLNLPTGDEIEEVAAEFNTMAEQLAASRRGLEERVRTATAELAREHNSLQAIVSALGEGLVVLDLDLRVVLWNRAAEKMTGFPAEEVIGRHCRSILRTEANGIRLCQGECPATAAMDSQKTIIAHGMSATIARWDGQRLPATYTTSPLVDASGSIRGCVVVLRDVAREKEIDRLKSEVVSTVSHELRSPLTSIIGFADLLDTPGLAREKRRQYTRFIVAEGRRIERIVDDFLTLSRLESGQFELKLEEIDLQQLVLEVFAAEAHASPHHDLRCQIPPGLPSIRADRDRIRRALQNLVNNAVKYSPDGGLVEVSAKAHGEVVEISVMDNGIGIRTQDLEKLFHRFQRVNRRDRPDIPGTGLGLAIVASIAREHGGEVRVESVHGKSSVFTLRLPLADRRGYDETHATQRPTPA